MRLAIPTLYCSFGGHYLKDMAYSQLCERTIFDFSFSEESLFSTKFVSVLDWFVHHIHAFAVSNDDDLFVICNSELSFENKVSNEDVVNSIISAGESGAQLLLGGLETARDL